MRELLKSICELIVQKEKRSNSLFASLEGYNKMSSGGFHADDIASVEERINYVGEELEILYQSRDSLEAFLNKAD